jgi:hypothetical protein
MENFKFDQKEYHKALSFFKTKQAGEVRKRLSRSQLDRLYPSDQPQVFRRLEDDAAKSL